MKKLSVLLLILFIVIFAAGCVMDSIYYCVYCGSGGVQKRDDGSFKCTKSDCGQRFGAKNIPEDETP